MLAACGGGGTDASSNPIGAPPAPAPVPAPAPAPVSAPAPAPAPTPAPIRAVDSFDGTGPLQGYTTLNATDLPNVGRADGRYRAELTSNLNNITQFYNDRQGRLDARPMTFPFEVIARNVGIGTMNDSQVSVTPGSANSYLLAGLQVHTLDLNTPDYSHLMVGHVGNAQFSVEGKNNRDAVTVFTSDGPNVIMQTRADLRIVGDANRNLTAYYQEPNPNPGVQADAWRPYAGTGLLPGTQADFGPEVYVGLATYAVGNEGVPFVGTCDSIEFVDP
jgi:hypothetical protein